MAKVRALLFIALAAVLACGICGQQAVAQEDLAGNAQGSAIAIGHVLDGAAEPAASAGMYQGIVAMGPNPPASSSDWPCFAGGTACAGIAAGGLVIGMPEQIWSKSCHGCGQIYYTFQTTTATGTATFNISVTQGSPATTIFHYSFTGSVGASTIEAVSVSGVSFKGGVAGAATINVSTTIGSATIKGGAKIVLH